MIRVLKYRILVCAPALFVRCDVASDEVDE
jgi:hypothetical protein